MMAGSHNCGEISLSLSPFNVCVYKKASSSDRFSSLCKAPHSSVCAQKSGEQLFACSSLFPVYLCECYKRFNTT